jgi:8-hydroxy-5-deazaflavin:NADPH oxidoreductase
VRIAIIGAGNVGSALARACITAGHTVALSARHAEHAAKLAAAVGGEAAETNAEAVVGADMVVLAVPASAVASIIDEIESEVEGKIVVDPTNPMGPESERLAAGGSAAEGIQILVPEARVVKAFNTVLASRMAAPFIDGVPLDGFYAGNDEDAKARVAELLVAIGYRPLDVGALLAARALEQMAAVHINLNARNGWPWQTGWKLLGPTS